MVLSKIQVINPGPSRPSCLCIVCGKCEQRARYIGHDYIVVK